MDYIRTVTNPLDLWVLMGYYITMKNTHLEHPEDAIFNNGKQGAIDVLKWFAAKNSTLSVKYDGAPAIVWGINPENNKFFVGTKSVFNKVKVKINYTHSDIELNHGSNAKVASILHLCLEKLPKVAGVYQGDWIGYGGSTEYKPNTITYKFDRRVYQDIVFAAHTTYHGDCMKDMSAEFAFPDNLHTLDVKLLDTACDIKRRKLRIGVLIALAKVLIRFTSFTDETIGKHVKVTVNSYIRRGVTPDPQKLAEETGLDVNLFHLYLLLMDIKHHLLDGIVARENVTCLIDDKVCAHEGFVMSNDYGTYKLVDRETFSYYNFNNRKDWK